MGSWRRFVRPFLYGRILILVEWLDRQNTTGFLRCIGVLLRKGFCADRSILTPASRSIKSTQERTLEKIHDAKKGDLMGVPVK